MAAPRLVRELSAVNGRLDDILIIRGVNLYPTEVELVLLALNDVSPTYQLIVDRPTTLHLANQDGCELFQALRQAWSGPTEECLAQDGDAAIAEGRRGLPARAAEDTLDRR
jgi:phenylacetate-CoA ligase